MGLAELLKPQSLDHYRGMTARVALQLTLTQDEAAVVLQAHDYGLRSLDAKSLAILDGLMSKLKDEVWP